MGISYHGNYLSWFEVCRVSMLDAIGQPYVELEANGYHLPVLEVGVKYASPSRFDDRLKVSCMIKEPPRARIRIDYEVELNGKIITTGFTVHAFMDSNGRPMKPPQSFLDSIEKLMG